MVSAVLIVACIGTLIPVVWMVSTSLKAPEDVFARPIQWLPRHADWSSYPTALDRRPFGLYTVNSIVTAGVSTLITVTVGSAAAFSFSHYRFRARDTLFLLVLSAFMIPLEVIVVPLYLEVHRFGWADTYWALVIPTAFAPQGVFILRQAMLAVPKEYVAAARVDGASELYILFRLVWPLIRPSLAAVAVYTFVASWNSYLWPLIAVSSDKLRTLPLGMALFENELTAQYPEVMAVAVMGSIPLVLLFVALQRAFVQGLLGVGLKE
ncbi:MAG: carbohydrate ABC transporter permease [Limnochordaceae bacterium]|nr:carbohydrate ABC transporter permease [Limnochordaceae bacterium]